MLWNRLRMRKRISSVVGSVGLSWPPGQGERPKPERIFFRALRAGRLPWNVKSAATTIGDHKDGIP